METTPPRSRLSCKTTKFKFDMKTENNSESSIGKACSKDDNEDSPMYFPTTQESNEDIDVLWDWHSPQTSERRRKKQKRLIPIQSPNIPIKRHPSQNKTTNFDKLRDELKLLQEELAMPDDESCLCVSPQQEVEFKSSDQRDDHSPFIKEQELQCENDLFDDSVDEQLVLFSQQIENEILEKEKTDHQEIKKQDSIYACDNTDINELINKYTKHGCDRFEGSIKEDQLHSTVFNVSKKETEQRNLSSRNNRFSFQRTYSDDTKSTRNVIQTMSGKLELHRTKSFELEAKKHTQVTLTKSKLAEIERNRLEALAKLALKKKRETNMNNLTQTSPPKCSPEEIEKKRLQALAKREAKRLEDIVERKRQEALKRLQASRMKNANLVKSTLTTRL